MTAHRFRKKSIKMNKLLSRSEEYVLLAVWHLQQDAYSLAIQQEISRITGHDWSLGSIYTPLERLHRKRLLTSTLSASTPERGGRKKRLYQLTNDGKRALALLRSVQAEMWKGVPEFELKGI